MFRKKVRTFILSSTFLFFSVPSVPIGPERCDGTNCRPTPEWLCCNDLENCTEWIIEHCNWLNTDPNNPFEGECSLGDE
jgi:hypothetical protein